jgi:hypothetical protein
MTRTTRTLVLAAALTLTPGLAQAQRSLSADDIAEIHNLYAHYNLMLDGGDSEGWADTFTEDGRFGNSEGRAALIAFADGFHARSPHTRHWNTNIEITATAEGAAGTCYLMLWNVGTSPASIMITGIYTDTLVRTPEGWRFKSRLVTPDAAAN